MKFPSMQANESQEKLSSFQTTIENHFAVLTRTTPYVISWHPTPSFPNAKIKWRRMNEQAA